MNTKFNVKVIVASLATVFLVVGCNGGSNSSTTATNGSASTSTTSPISAQTVAATQKVEMINDNSATPFSFSTTKIGATDSHSFRFTNTTGHPLYKTVLKIDNPNFSIDGVFRKQSDGSYQSTETLDLNGGLNFTVDYTGTDYTDTAKTTTITVEYYIVNDERVMEETPGTTSFPIQYQATNGPAVINPSVASIAFREVLANNNDSDSYLLNLTNDSETPSGKIEFNTVAPFSIESTTCTTLAPHDSCSVKVDFGKTNKIEEFDIGKAGWTKPKHGANLEIKYFAENGNISAKTKTVALAGSIVPADKVYVKLESAVAGGRLFGGDGTTKTPYNVEIGGSPLNLQLTYRNTGSFVVDSFNLNTAKLPTGYTVVKNDCANVSLATNATCSVSLNAATRKLGAENLDLSSIPASWTGHDAAAINYAGNNTINVNIHPKSTYQLETELPHPSTPKADRWYGPTRYFEHNDLIKVSVSGTNLDSSYLDLRIDPKSLPKGMECVGGDDENGDPCKAVLDFSYPLASQFAGVSASWVGLVMDRSVPDGVYRIKATSQGRNIYADIMVSGWWQVGNAPAGTEITGLAAAGNNVYAVAANNTKVFYNNSVVSPKGAHNWSATKGVANMTKLAVNDGSLCLVSNGKELYSSASITKGVQGLTRNFSVDKNINSIACMSGENKSLAASGNNVYYYNGETKTPQALATALNPITSMVANNSKVYFADNTKTIYTALNSYNPNAPKVSPIPQTGTDLQGQKYWPNYSWLLALSSDKTKLFSQVLNKTNSTDPRILDKNDWSFDKGWIYGSYTYRTSDDGATWNTDSRLGQPYRTIFPNFLPAEMVASNQFAWSIDVDNLGGTYAPNPGTLTQCGWPTKPTAGRDSICSFVDSPFLEKYENPKLDHTYGYNHLAYDPTYNMVFYSDNAGNIFGVWGNTPNHSVPYPGTPTYY